MTPAETIKRLEAVREWLIERRDEQSQPDYIEEYQEHLAAIESALAALREQDQRASAVGASSHDAAIGSPATSDQSEAHPFAPRQSEREKAAREAAQICHMIAKGARKVPHESATQVAWTAEDIEKAILKHFNLEAK